MLRSLHLCASQSDITLAATGDQSCIEIIVSDTGIGISAEALATIFEPCVQHAAAIEFNSTGLGIGLSVVPELVVAHGGIILADSPGVNLGSRFVITLPRAPETCVTQKRRRPTVMGWILTLIQHRVPHRMMMMSKQASAGALP